MRKIHFRKLLYLLKIRSSQSSGVIKIVLDFVLFKMQKNVASGNNSGITHVDNALPVLEGGMDGKL